MSLRFFALLLPLIRFNFIKGRVELDFSRISQLFVTILSHSLKLGWKVVMRNVLSFSSSSVATGMVGLRSVSLSRWYTLAGASLITFGG